MAKRTWVTVDLGSQELRKQVQRLAAQNERTLSAEIRVAIKEHVIAKTPLMDRS